MSLTVSEAENIIAELQAVQAYESAVDFWNKYPEYRNGRTLETYAAEYRRNDDRRIDWDDLESGSIDGHEFKVVEQLGGEGEGDYAHVVFSVDDQLFKREGYYSSYEGTNWEEYSTVKAEAYDVTVTKYRKAK